MENKPRWKNFNLNFESDPFFGHLWNQTLIGLTKPGRHFGLGASRHMKNNFKFWPVTYIINYAIRQAIEHLGRFFISVFLLIFMKVCRGQEQSSWGNPCAPPVSDSPASYCPFPPYLYKILAQLNPSSVFSPDTLETWPARSPFNKSNTCITCRFMFYRKYGWEEKCETVWHQCVQ